MASVTTTVKKKPYVDSKGNHRMEIVTERGTSVVVPFAPQNVNHGERGVEWAEVDRFGTYGTFRRTGLKVPTLSFGLTLAVRNSHGRKDISKLLKKFDAMSESESRIYINFTAREAGAWLMTSYSANITHRNASQIPTRAEVSFVFSRIMDEKAFFGPIKGRSTSIKVTPARAPKKKTNTSATLAVYVVKKGDTLWDLARKYYGNPYKWTRLADRNGVRNPRLLQIGKRLIIPKL